MAFQHLERAYKKGGERLFTRVCSDRRRGNIFKLKESRFRLDVREEILYEVAGETLEQVAQRSDPWDPSLEMFKVRLDGALSNLI